MAHESQRTWAEQSGTAMRLGIIVSAVMVSVRHSSPMVPLRIWSGLLRQCHTPDC
jgi:hypothetical protein